MAKDLKALEKMIYDMEKRLKFNEAKIKVLADAMTDSKDIEKYLDVLYKKIGRELSESESVSRKLQTRQIEMSERAYDTREKERDKAWDKGSKQREKEIEKLNKDYIRKAEMNMVLTRLTALEARK